MSALPQPASLAVRVDRKAILPVLQLCAGVVAKRDTMPILQCVKIVAGATGLLIEATDTDVTVQLACVADVVEPGAFAISYDTFVSFLKNAPDDSVALSFDDRPGLVVESGTAKFRLPVLDAMDFPQLPAIEDDKSLTVDAEILRDALVGTLYCVSGNNDVRYNGRFGMDLRGILVTSDGGGTLDFCAADGYRLAVAYAEFPRGSKLHDFIPTKAARMIQKFRADGDVTIRVNKNHTHLQFADGSKLAYRGQGVNFPNYREIIPTTHDRHIIANRERLIGAVQRVQSLTPDQDRGLQFSATREGRLTIRPIRPERGEGSDYLAVDASDTFRFAMDGLRLTAALEACASELVTLGVTNRMVTIEPSTQEGQIEFKHLVVPRSETEGAC